METREAKPRTRASAVLDWARESASRDPDRPLAEGIADGLLIGLALVRLDPAWAGEALEELLVHYQAELAAKLNGTPMTAPTIEHHRLLAYTEVQGIQRSTGR